MEHQGIDQGVLYVTDLIYSQQLNEYNQKIERLREKMIHTATNWGLNHPQVLNYSRKIDETHNLILRMEKEQSVYR